MCRVVQKLAKRTPSQHLQLQKTAHARYGKTCNGLRQENGSGSLCIFDAKPVVSFFRTVSLFKVARLTDQNEPSYFSAYTKQFCSVGFPRYMSYERRLMDWSIIHQYERESGKQPDERISTK